MDDKTTIKNLLEELEKTHNLKDRRLIVLLLFLYAEYYSIKLIKKHHLSDSFDYVCECGKKTGARSFTLEERINKLIGIKCLKPEDLCLFRLLNKIRNRLIHDLSPNNKKIESWIQEFAPSTTTKELSILLKKENPWIKFYVSLVAATANMYHILYPSGQSLKFIEKGTTTGRWIFHIKE